MRIRTQTIQKVTQTLTSPVLAPRRVPPSISADQYAYRHAITHLLTTGAVRDAQRLTRDLTYTFYRAGVDFPTRAERWRLECWAARLDAPTPDWDRFEQRLSEDLLHPIDPPLAVLQCAERVGGAPLHALRIAIANKSFVIGRPWIRASCARKVHELGTRFANGVTHWAVGQTHCWLAAHNRVAYRRIGGIRSEWIDLPEGIRALATQPKDSRALGLLVSGTMVSLSFEAGTIRIRPEARLSGACGLSAAWGAWMATLESGALAWLPPGADEWEQLVPPGAGRIESARLSSDGQWIQAHRAQREYFWRIGQTQPTAPPSSDTSWQPSTLRNGVKVHGRQIDVAELAVCHGVSTASVREVVGGRDGSSALALANGRWSLRAPDSRPRQIQLPFDEVVSAALGIDGSRLVVVGRHRGIWGCRVYSTISGKLLWRSTESRVHGPPPGDLSRHSAWQRRVVGEVFARSKDRFAWTKGTMDEIVSLAEVRGGYWRQVQSWTLPHTVVQLAWSGRRLFASTAQNDLWVLEASGARRLHAFGYGFNIGMVHLEAHHSSEVLALFNGEGWSFPSLVKGVADNPLDVSLLALSPDGRTVLSAQRGGGAHLWDATSGELRAELDDPRHKLRRALFSADGARVALGCVGMYSDWGWTVFEVSTGARVAVFAHQEYSRAEAETRVREALACPRGGPVVPLLGRRPEAGERGSVRFVSLADHGWCADSPIQLVLPVGQARWFVGDAAGVVWFLQVAAA